MTPLTKYRNLELIDMVLLACITELLPQSPLLAILFDSNKDIFLGIANDKQSMVNVWAIFQSEDRKRIEALAFVFRKLLEKQGIKSKYMVQVRKTIPKNWEIIRKAWQE